ncbi:uncharacterized protein LOC119371836 [Rhipicephalus sanguineus]|uniref:uncharacterized protein LOC119371836 n=1 Tax=Rhipicephalus sanguineus TaxID=34632 RepID=UPI0018943401|nr:uncharacterized protein LOC119371836 [Rhipicephalus sanguineus]
MRCVKQLEKALLGASVTARQCRKYKGSAEKHSWLTALKQQSCLSSISEEHIMLSRKCSLLKQHHTLTASGRVMYLQFKQCKGVPSRSDGAWKYFKTLQLRCPWAKGPSLLQKMCRRQTLLCKVLLLLFLRQLSPITPAPLRLVLPQASWCPDVAENCCVTTSSAKYEASSFPPHPASQFWMVQR